VALTTTRGEKTLHRQAGREMTMIKHSLFCHSLSLLPPVIDNRRFYKDTYSLHFFFLYFLFLVYAKDEEESNDV
jgi:hypothetical protein